VDAKGETTCLHDTYPWISANDGRSQDCFAVADCSVPEIMTRLGPGRLIYANEDRHNCNRSVLNPASHGRTPEHRGALACMTSFNSRYRQLFHVFATPHEVWLFLPTEG
jgi:hypothetical protein